MNRYHRYTFSTFMYICVHRLSLDLYSYCYVIYYSGVVKQVANVLMTLY